MESRFSTITVCRGRRRSCCLLAALVMSFICLIPAAAQAQKINPDRAKSGRFKILHNPPRPDALPMPGEAMVLTVHLENIAETHHIIQAALYRDGKAIMSASPDAYLDEKDQASYDLRILAPQAELAYQFFFESPDGAVIESKRYFLRRKCRHDLQHDNIQWDQELSISERVPFVVQKAAKLEQEIASYTTGLQLIEELKELVKE